MAVNLTAAPFGLLPAAVLAGPVIGAFARTEAIAQGTLRSLAVFSVVILAEAIGAGSPASSTAAATRAGRLQLSRLLAPQHRFRPRPDPRMGTIGMSRAHATGLIVAQLPSGGVRERTLDAFLARLAGRLRRRFPRLRRLYRRLPRTEQALRGPAARDARRPDGVPPRPHHPAVPEAIECHLRSPSPRVEGTSRRSGIASRAPPCPRWRTPSRQPSPGAERHGSDRPLGHRRSRPAAHPPRSCRHP